MEGVDRETAVAAGRFLRKAGKAKAKATTVASSASTSPSYLDLELEPFLKKKKIKYVGK